jgi:hypothetical protein
MTLGMSLVVLGFMTVYQLLMVQTGTRRPGRARDDRSGTTGGRSRTACGLRPARRRSSSSACGGRASAGCCTRRRQPDRRAAGGCPRLAGPGRPVHPVRRARRDRRASSMPGSRTPARDPRRPVLLPSVAAAVIGGTSILGGRGGYSGTIVGALILTVLTSLLTVLQMPEAVRQILFGAIIVVVAAAYTRVTGEIDLGATNIKWVLARADPRGRPTRCRGARAGGRDRARPARDVGRRHRCRVSRGGSRTTRRGCGDRRAAASRPRTARGNLRLDACAGVGAAVTSVEVVGRLVLDDRVVSGRIVVDDGRISEPSTSTAARHARTSRSSPRASSTSTSTAGAATMRWAIAPPSTGWPGSCSATA